MLVSSQRHSGGHAWASDGASLAYFQAGDDGRLWRVRRSRPHNSVPLGYLGPDRYYLTASAGTGRLAYVLHISDTNIWRQKVEVGSTATKFVSTTRREAGGRYSPDGKRGSVFLDRLWYRRAIRVRQRRFQSSEAYRLSYRRLGGWVTPMVAGRVADRF